MQQWKCNKIVQAFKVCSCVREGNNWILSGEDGECVQVSGEWHAKHFKGPGGYFVRDAPHQFDKHTSYITAKEFEPRYTKLLTRAQAIDESGLREDLLSNVVD